MAVEISVLEPYMPAAVSEAEPDVVVHQLTALSKSLDLRKFDRDFADVKKKFFKSTDSPVEGTDADYSPFHDVDGSGSILARDFAEVKKRFFQDLPAPPITPTGSWPCSPIPPPLPGWAPRRSRIRPSGIASRTRRRLRSAPS